MRAKLRIPTAESFAFIEVDMEGDEHEIHDTYQRMTAIVRSGFGLDDTEWHQLLDEYRTTGKIVGDPGMLEACNAEQKRVLNELKKSFKRANYKEDKQK
jgi:hypothetical protein